MKLPVRPARWKRALEVLVRTAHVLADVSMIVSTTIEVVQLF